MLGKTHMAAGAATALAVLQPTTVSGCICALAGGIVGGWIPDIDMRGRFSSGGADKEGEDGEELAVHADERWQILVFALIAVAICLVADYFAGDGMCEYVASHLGIPMAVAGAAFAVTCAYGIASAHRTVTHSVLGGVALAGSMHFICAPLAPAFVLGYASHIVLDLFNKRRIQLFWPLKLGVKFGACVSNGIANKVVGAVSLVSCLALFSLSMASSVGGNSSFMSLFQAGGNQSAAFAGLGLTNFQIYLVVINVLAFLVYLIDYFAWSKGAYGDDPENDRQDFVHTIFLLLLAAGGALGMLLAVVIGTRGRLVRGEQGTVGFYTYGLCFLIVWACVCLIAFTPSTPSADAVASTLKGHHVVLIAFSALNVLAFVVFLLDGRRYRKANAREIGEFVLVLAGGATGAYLAMVLTNHKMGTAQFGQGVPAMMAMHYVLLAVGHFNGYLYLFNWELG